MDVKPNHENKNKIGHGLRKRLSFPQKPKFEHFLLVNPGGGTKRKIKQKYIWTKLQVNGML